MPPVSSWRTETLVSSSSRRRDSESAAIAAFVAEYVLTAGNCSWETMLAWLTIFASGRRLRSGSSSWVRCVAQDVHLHHRVDVVERLVLQQPADELACVVDEHVDLRAVLAEAGESGVDALARAEVELDDAGVAADRIEARGIADAAQHAHGLVCQALDERAAQPAARAGDEDGLAFETLAGAHDAAPLLDAAVVAKEFARR